MSIIHSQKQSSFYPEKFVFIVLVHLLHSTASAKRKKPQPCSSRVNLITFGLLYYFLSPHSPHILNLVLPIAVPSAGCKELLLCAYKPCLGALGGIVSGSLQSAILDNTAKNATTQKVQPVPVSTSFISRPLHTNHASPGVQNGRGCDSEWG